MLEFKVTMYDTRTKVYREVTIYAEDFHECVEHAIDESTYYEYVQKIEFIC